MESVRTLMKNPLRFLFSLALASAPLAPAAAEKPNIIFILADDLGFGDIRAMNPEGKIATPHADRLAAEGMIFTDAHSSSSVCTPTRYSVLTGRYNWRSRMKKGVLNGFSPRLIEPGRQTVAGYLKENGYATSCLGKWHLGMNWPQNDGKPAGTTANPSKIDYTRPIEDGPTTLGFDEFFGISASLDMPPFVFIKNDRVTEVPTVEKTFYRRGPAGENFEAVDVLPELTRRAVAYIERRAPASKNGEPFFLYLPLASPHTPIVPTAEWQEKSGLNAYADFVMQTDATVGAVLDALDRGGIAEDTLVIFTSDNGCSREADFPLLLSKGHNPSYHFRGWKSDIFEGGHRVPFLVRWPSKVKAGTVSDQLICLTDLFATCAGILGTRLPDEVAEDSVSILPAMDGSASGPLREAAVHHSIYGGFSIRKGAWKLCLCPDSGGWSEPIPGSPETLKLPPVQLYDLRADIGETRNLQAEHPEVVARLTKLLELYVENGRSTPGARQQNTGAVDIRPRMKAPKQ
jgi:arylsulfatase A-like enzyme